MTANPAERIHRNFLNMVANQIHERPRGVNRGRPILIDKVPLRSSSNQYGIYVEAWPQSGSWGYWKPIDLSPWLPEDK